MKKLLKSTCFTAATLCAIIMLFASTARAETTQCTPITTIPITIAAQGIYCFNGNLAGSLASGGAITIETNNVTIDMNGYKLGNLAAGAGTNAYGIWAYQRKNITIRNGTIRGFLRGIGLSDTSPYTASSGHLIEDVRFDGNTWEGIFVAGTGNIIRNNQVVNTGGTTNFNASYGILSNGPGTRIINNDIIDVTATTGGAYGIRISSGNGTVVEGNRINNLASTGSSYGIYIAASSGIVVEGNRVNKVASTGTGSLDFARGVYLSTSNNSVVEANRISNISSGSATAFGVYTANSSNVTVSDNRIAGVVDFGVLYSGSGGIYMNNTVSGSATPFSGGSAAGTTNYSN